MRVLFVHPGPDRTEAALAGGLLDRGIGLAILTRGRGKRNPLLRGHRVESLPIHTPWDLPAMWSIRRMVGNGAFDIVHIFNGEACLPTLVAVRGLWKPKVFLYRGAIVKVSRLSPRDRVRYFGGRVDCFVASCEAVRKSLIAAGIAPARTVTVYKGHDPKWYDAEPINLRRRFGISPAAFVAGTVANARKAKGLHYLIRCASLLEGSSGKFAIVIVGRDRKGILSTEVRRLEQGSRRERCPVYLAGEIPDGFRAMRSFDCFVMPSLEGAFGIDKSVVEAMSQRLPVVVTRAAGLPEIVEHERNGLVIPPGSPRAIAEAILRLANEPELRRRMGRAARQTVAERLTVQRMVDNTIRTYQRFLD
jgi:glycosyltransferase involved in cell wall biosynthesis